jgi:hypothetical protein
MVEAQGIRGASAVRLVKVRANRQIWKPAPVGPDLYKMKHLHVPTQY